ncbi:MAG: SH3 domain-containing protein [Armatimonadota bacterium]
MRVTAYIAAILITVPILLVPSSALSAKARPAWVIPETLNVRSGPGTDRKKIGTLSRGDKVFVTAFANKWCWGKLPDGSWGWIAEWLLQFSYEKGRALAEEAAASHRGNSGSPTPAWVKEAAVNVRSGPGLGYDKFGTISGGHKVYITDRKSGWCRVSTGNGYGWIRGDLLEYDVSAGRKLAEKYGSDTSSSSSTSRQTATAKVFVDGDVVNLRKGPGMNYESVAKLREGQTLYVTETRDKWCKAHVHGGTEGWVANWLIKYPDDTSGSESGTPTSPPVSRQGEGTKNMSAWICEEVVNIRSGPDRDKEIVFQLERGTKVTTTDISGHWVKIKTDGGKSGWVAGWVVSFVPPGKAIVAEEGDTKVNVHVGWVARPKVNLRAEPSLDAKRIGYATLSTRVLIVDQKGDWYKVAMENGEVGWMAGWLIDTRAQRRARQSADTMSASAASGGSQGSEHADFPSPTTDGSIGERLVSTARKYLGYQYVSGCSSPSVGFDCSGFVHYVMKCHGISVSRSSRAQYRQGSPVSRSSLIPGDVVFFRNTYRPGISHVGLYLGNDKFIHASNSRRDVVIDSLNSSYYAPRYAGARRMY